MKKIFCLILLLLSCGCSTTGWRDPPPVSDVIIIYDRPTSDACNFVKDFKVVRIANKLSNVLKWTRNEAKIKAFNLGSNYIILEHGILKHHRYLNIFKRDKYEFKLFGKAYSCSKPLKRMYRTTKRRHKYSPRDVVVLEKDSPSNTECKYLKDLYVNDRPPKHKKPESFKSFIQSQLKIRTSGDGANLIKPDILQFSSYTGEYVVYARLFICSRRYINSLK